MLDQPGEQRAAQAAREEATKEPTPTAPASCLVRTRQSKPPHGVKVGAEGPRLGLPILMIPKLLDRHTWCDFCHLARHALGKCHGIRRAGRLLRHGRSPDGRDPCGWWIDPHTH